MHKRQKSKNLASLSKTPTKELIEKIILKKEFSQLPEKDVEIAFSHFDKPQYLDEEKIKLTRDLLRKVFSVFTSKKLLKIKDKSEEFILKKHLSTKERYEFYDEIYKKLLYDFQGKINIIDLGAGVNGFSYDFFNKLNKKVNYLGVEAMGQLVEFMNYYFKKKKIKGEAVHMSLFELEEIKSLIKKQEHPKIIFLFKTLDSLEMLERNYSKKLLKAITPLVKRVVISFATRSLVSKKRFAVKRNWILNFIKSNFVVLDDFEIGNEKYIVFCKTI